MSVAVENVWSVSTQWLNWYQLVQTMALFYINLDRVSFREYIRGLTSFLFLLFHTYGCCPFFYLLKYTDVFKIKCTSSSK